MDFIDALAGREMAKIAVTIPEFDTAEEKGLFEVRELTIADRMAVREASWALTGESDEKGRELKRWDEARNNLAWIAYATFRPDGRRVFSVPDAIGRLLQLSGRFEAPLGKLLSAALEVNLATVQAEGSARKNSRKTRTSATS